MARSRTCKQCWAPAFIWIEGYPYCSRECYEKREARRNAARPAETPTSPSKPSEEEK